MRNPFANGVGGVLSADIAVPEHERELGFYSSILTTGDEPLWRDDLMNNLGAPIIGLGIRTPEYESLPLQWMPHFQVADVAASAASAVSKGGKELMHSKSDDGPSQWAVLVDQAGAAFGVIPVVDGETDSAYQNGQNGCIAWLSLIVEDVSTSKDFYESVLGWGAKAMELEDSEGSFNNFEMLREKGIAAAEICQYRSEHNGIPAAWLIHLPVSDLVESLRRVREGGGEILNENAEAESAVIRDPVGAYFALQAGR